MSDTNDKPQPTEEQVKAANEAQAAHWEGDFKEEDLKIPYKREEEDVDGKDAKSDDDKNEEDAGKSDKDNSSSNETEEYSEPAPTVTVQDPGEFKPADYSFQVTNKDGKTITIKTPEEADAFGDDDDNFKSAADLKDFIRKSNKMENSLDKEKEKWQTQKDTFEAQTQANQQRNEAMNAIESEVNYLVSKNKLPAVAKEYQTMNWDDPEVAKQPGVKEQIALLNYMSKENAIRAKAGIKPFGPVDAFTAMQSDAAEKAKVADAKAAGEQRKVNGARVAGTSPSQTGAFVPKGIAVGRPGVFNRGVANWEN